VRDDAAAALTKLARQPQDATIPPDLADAFMFQAYYRERSPDALGKEFGPNFALAVAKMPPGAWQGPIESGLGWHLVFVDTLIPGRVPAFEEVEPVVRRSWLTEQKELARQKAYQEIRSTYTVILPVPDEGASRGRAMTEHRS
jgi:hypothetical protein